MARDYKEKDVKGIFTNSFLINPTTVTVRITNDKIGQSLSLCAGGIMIMIALEDVKEIIRLVEK